MFKIWPIGDGNRSRSDLQKKATAAIFRLHVCAFRTSAPRTTTAEDLGPTSQSVLLLRNWQPHSFPLPWPQFGLGSPLKSHRVHPEQRVWLHFSRCSAPPAHEMASPATADSDQVRLFPLLLPQSTLFHTDHTIPAPSY